MTDPYISEYVHLGFKRGEARIRKSSSVTGAKSTVLKVEIEVFDPYTLSLLVQGIQEAMRPLPKKAAGADQERLLLEGQRLLPAPRLRLEGPR